MQKRGEIEKAAFELRKNIGLMNRCCGEFGDAVEEAIGYMVRYREESIGKLRKELEETEAAVELAVLEAVNCLDQGKLPDSPLAQAILALPIDQFGTFTYRIEQPNVKSVCESWLTYQNKLNLELQHLSKEADSPIDTPLTCKKCDKTYPKAYFLQLDQCGCRICLYCEAKLLQPASQTCLCGTYFDIERLNQCKEICINCSRL